MIQYFIRHSQRDTHGLIGLMLVRAADKGRRAARPWVGLLRRKQSLLNKSGLLPARRRYFSFVRIGF